MKMKQWKKRMLGLGLSVVMAFGSAVAAPALSTEAKSVPKITMSSTENGSYSGYHAVPDRTFLYKKGKKELHVVSVIGMKLTDYTLNPKYSVTSVKKIKLPRYNEWGGYFHSEKGQHYVAIGFDNTAESETKTVIRVIKYDKDWEKAGQVDIHGYSSNGQGLGVYKPFDYGNVSFTENGDTLYLMTARTMFSNSEGLHSQSNIAFAINTKKMESHTNNVSYCSHSFNQFARFKDGNLYLVDQGDAHPRGVQITIYDDFGKAQGDLKSNAIRSSVTAFAFQGDVGNNATGATVGGMEVSNSYVLVTGSAQPHGSSVDGVTGFASGYGENLYLIKRSTSTGECSIRWLTSYNPAISGATVECPRMVKVNNNLFAILYTIKNVNNGKRYFHCMYIDGSGQKIKDAPFSNIQFRGGTQPIVFNNRIVFVEKPSNLQNVQIYNIPTK
ncbi:MAG: hypothetical protein IJ679_05890 [Lachnospiraceae bacterium]|nr:hypothetical protein [Lachnospiraceae bacterium]